MLFPEQWECPFRGGESRQNSGLSFKVLDARRCNTELAQKRASLLPTLYGVVDEDITFVAPRRQTPVKISVHKAFLKSLATVSEVGRANSQYRAANGL